MRPASARNPSRVDRGIPVALVTVIAVVAVAAVVATFAGMIVFAGSHRDSSPVSSGSQSYAPPAPAVGYVGVGANTGLISSSWASGVETAWRLPVASTANTLGPVVYVEGTTLYVHVREQDYSSDARITFSAYDVSLAEPRELWSTRATTPAFVSSQVVSFGGQLIVGSILFDKETGAQAGAPWEGSSPVAAVGDTVVTCDGHESCSGWSLESSFWQRKWTAVTAEQKPIVLDAAGITYPDSPVVHSPDGVAVLLSTRPVQILDPDSGKVTNLADPRTQSERAHIWEEPVLASDGIVVVGEKTFLAYDTSGFVVGMGARKETKRMPAFEGRLPTVSQLADFLTGAPPAWSNVTVTARQQGTPQSVILDVALSDAGPGITLDPNNNDLHRSYFDFWPSAVRASADGSVLYVQGPKDRQGVGRLFFDTTTGVAHGSNELIEAWQLTWAFDDLLVGVTPEGIIALTPRSS